MNVIRRFFDNQHKHFRAGGRLAPFEPFYEAIERVFFGAGHVTEGAPHPRDSLSVQRYMMLVIVMLLPCLFFGMYNVGLQAFKAAGQPLDFWPMFGFGFQTVMPLVIISYMFGFGWEVVFSVVRRHPISEGVFVTCMLFPLILPPTIPWWQAALGISFGVVIGKEIFGGTGRNFLNPALTGRAFLFFAYPAQLSGDEVWTATLNSAAPQVDALSAATPLVVAGEATQNVEATLAAAGYDLSTLFFGFYPDAIGASSAFLCLLGAIGLIVLGIASYRTIVGSIAGIMATGYLLNLIANEASMPYLSMNPLFHLLTGGAAIGIVYMATDPVSSPHTHAARWVYGFLIGVLTVLIRVFNPAFPEGIMLAILFMNVFAPLLDQLVVRKRIRNRIPNLG
jgi:Na+-transporting NADH:ubiquinone oxidoreductase subunit B